MSVRPPDATGAVKTVSVVSGGVGVRCSSGTPGSCLEDMIS